MTPTVQIWPGDQNMERSATANQKEVNDVD